MLQWETLLVSLSYGKSEAFHGVDVHYHGMVYVLYILECLYESGDVVAIFHIAVAIAHGTEYIWLGGAVCVAEQPKVGVEASMVFGYAHLVIVDHNDEIRAKCRAEVKAFESHSTAKGAIAYHSYYILV